MESVPPKEGDPMEGVLRIVSNRCRNLKKAIERATALEKAVEGGKTVNAEQLESIKVKPVRISMLHELEEILRKQTAIVTPPKLSKRAAKRLQKEKNIASSNNGSDLPPEQEKKNDTVNGQDPVEDNISNANLSTDRDTISSSNTEPVSGRAESQSEKEQSDKEQSEKEHSEKEQSVTEQPVADTKKTELAIAAQCAREAEHTRQLKFATQATMDSVLEIAHVVTFINQPGGRECINRFFEAGHRGLNGRKVNYMDMEVLLYFYRMLTSPNGNIPHEQALQTSVAHCSAYLEFSTNEAFPGTTYKTLREIVRSIATCPLLANRSPHGLSSGNQRPGGGTHSAQRNAAGLPKNGERLVNPSSLVHEATMQSHF